MMKRSITLSHKDSTQRAAEGWAVSAILVGETSTFYDGKTVVIVGRSNNVGKLALWLALDRNATVVSCDKHTADAGMLTHFTRQADILIVAAGVPSLVTADMVKDGVIAVDVGINPVTNPTTGRTHLVGDIDTDDVAQRAEAVTPVPGGVGPLTDVWLVHNAVRAATALHPRAEGTEHHLRRLQQESQRSLAAAR
jgi:methylenetetrahydrofolate dehydrogenase (NADP+) / methenyltetrahydrofolate cyclohydrolase